jgi:hypothetical protein
LTAAGGFCNPGKSSPNDVNTETRSRDYQIVFVTRLRHGTKRRGEERRGEERRGEERRSEPYHTRADTHR